MVFYPIFCLFLFFNSNTYNFINKKCNKNEDCNGDEEEQNAFCNSDQICKCMEPDYHPKNGRCVPFYCSINSCPPTYNCNKETKICEFLNYPFDEDGNCKPGMISTSDGLYCLNITRCTKNEDCKYGGQKCKNISEENKICQCPIGTNLTYYHECISFNNDKNPICINYILYQINFIAFIIFMLIIPIYIYILYSRK